VPSRPGCRLFSSSVCRVLGLGEADSRAGGAAHELGHAVLWLTHGIHVVDVGVGVGRAECAQPAPGLRGAWTVAVAAGERAQDRWLREQGLWTRGLGAFAEIGTRADRAAIFAADPVPRPGFGDGGPDYADLHALADDALDRCRPMILRAIPHLLDAGTMTGDHLAACLETANPAPSDAASV